MPDKFKQPAGAPRGNDGAEQPVLGPRQTVTIRYTDGCAVYGLRPDDPTAVMLVNASHEAIIEVNRPIRLVLGVASPDVQERYRGR